MEIAALLAGLPARISDIPRHWAARARDAHALHEGARYWTYGQLSAATDAVAQLLREHGVRPGDRVMVLGENCAAQVMLTFAAASIDAWIVQVNGRLSAREVDTIREHSGARRVFYLSGSSAQAGAHGARHSAFLLHAPLLGDMLVGLQNDACVPEPVAPSNFEQVAALIYTTGTTGQSKGVMLSHRNLLFIAAVSSTLRGLSPNDRV